MPWGKDQSLGVYHYDPEFHQLEHRAVLPAAAVPSFSSSVFYVGLSSIYWRESWKYGVRAFRYCALDMGHALAALQLSARLLGWDTTLVVGAEASAEALGRLLGTSRSDGGHAGEIEEAEVLIRVHVVPAAPPPPIAPLFANSPPTFFGVANRLSTEGAHFPWADIASVATATPFGGILLPQPPPLPPPAVPAGESKARSADDAAADALAASIIRKRRSAHAFDPKAALGKHAFLNMMRRLVPTPDGVAPWSVLAGLGVVEVPFLGIFVHRVSELAPGQYVLVRDASALATLKDHILLKDFEWERVTAGLELFLVRRANATQAAKKVSCDQDIARDGFFTVGAFADVQDLRSPAGAEGDTCVSSPIDPHRYRRKYWEAGVVGHLLYLDIHALGHGATGIGCFEDDPMRSLWVRDAGARPDDGSDLTPLYHVAVGSPMHDRRITSHEPYEGIEDER